MNCCSGLSVVHLFGHSRGHSQPIVFNIIVYILVVWSMEVAPHLAASRSLTARGSNWSRGASHRALQVRAMNTLVQKDPEKASLEL